MSARYPFTPFPTSWYFVARSHEVAPASVKSLRLCGQDLVVYRTASGALTAAHAHCPHLGAHLGDGRVEGEALRCPFHGWGFAAGGDCSDVPYADKVPPKARLRTLPVREVNGLIFVFHHVDGGCAAVPDFEIPEIPEYGSGGWSPYHTLRYEARVHIQETAENAVDLPHFHYLHKHLEVPTLDLFELDGAVFQVKFRAARKVLGRVVPTQIHLTYVGMGLVIARVTTPVVRLILQVKYTPLDAETLAINLSYMLEKGGLPVVGRLPLVGALLDRVLPFFILRDANEDYARDIPIWEKKIYLERPVLASGDGPIMKLRRWAQQFYGGDARSLPVVTRAVATAASES